MIIYFSDELMNLFREIRCWIIDYEPYVDEKGNKGDFVPVFRDDTPQEIFDKYPKYCEMLDKEYKDALPNDPEYMKLLDEEFDASKVKYIVRKVPENTGRPSKKRKRK